MKSKSCTADVKLTFSSCEVEDGEELALDLGG